MNNKERKIIETLKTKSLVKKNVYKLMKDIFNEFKDVAQEQINILNTELYSFDNRLILEYKEKSQFEFEIKVAGDVLIFQMHTNVFEFYRSHRVWQTSYLRDNKMSSYSGIINVYNFLADSFKYNRKNDLGYLIARVFINKDRHYFVEGKRQLGFMYSLFGDKIIEKESIEEIINTAILYSLEFDLLVPPYDDMKVISVHQIEQSIENSNVKTGKRLGFQFYADDIP